MIRRRRLFQGATATSAAGWPTLARSLGLLVLALVGCHRKHADDGTRLIVGVQSEPMGGIASSLHVVIKRAGTVIDDEVVKPPRGSRVGFPQPWEKTVLPGDKPGETLDVEVDVLGSVTSDQPTSTLLTRRSSTRFVPGRAALLRVPLEARCIVYPASANPKVGPGPLSGPTCTAPATCIKGLCQSPVVPPQGLEPYAANWPTNAPDLCKARGGGAPIVTAGTGQTGFTPLARDQVLTAEAGPQGGHHIWIAVRMKNLRQAGTVTKISAVQPDTGKVIPPSNFAFTFDADEGGYCKLYGLRYQLDNGGIDYRPFLGKPLDVTTTLVDSNGVTATSTAHIQIAPNLLNP